MDRVKAAIFSSLGARVIGAEVLDLFAGTGALGIEALSRGAASALFVERDAAAVRAIEQNFVRTKLRGRVSRQDVFRFLATAHRGQMFDIILADPPYGEAEAGRAFTELLLHQPDLPGMLARSGVFVLEKRPGEDLPVTRAWRVVRAKTYGATEVLFFATTGVAADGEGSA